MNNHYILKAIGIISLGTIFLRFAPFLIFRKHTPKIIIYLGNVLPAAIMAMLVVYCLKYVSFGINPYGIPEICSLIVVILLHKWKHQTLLSIISGTCLYMFLIQVIFQ